MVHELVVAREGDTLKANLKRCSIVPADLETLVMEQCKWRSLCKTSIQQFESDRIRALEAKREQRKTATILSAACYPCQICGQTCASRIGLYSHSRTHQHWLRSGIRRVDGPVQSIKKPYMLGVELTAWPPLGRSLIALHTKSSPHNSTHYTVLYPHRVTMPPFRTISMPYSWFLPPSCG